MRDRRRLPSRQRTYIRLYARVDRLEDAISHFYNVINELRRRVSTLEKKLKPLNGGGGERRSPELYIAGFARRLVAVDRGAPVFIPGHRRTSHTAMIPARIRTTPASPGKISAAIKLGTRVSNRCSSSLMTKHYQSARVFED